LYEGNNDFKKGYQPRGNIEKSEAGDVFTGTHRIRMGVGKISLSC
jgi:hypothetical protein